MIVKKFLKLIPLAVLVGLVAYQLWQPVTPGRAAPAELPVCGHQVISGSSKSGPPDMAQSPNGYYTAVAWAEDNVAGYGRIVLAYTNVATTTRYWQTIVVDSTGLNETPSITFDSNDEVHVAYQRGRSEGASYIYYARCNLTTKTCTTPAQASNTGKPGVVRQNAQIVVNSDDDPVIFYQESVTGGGVRSYMNYTFLRNGTTFNPVEGTTALDGPSGLNKPEFNPTAVAAGDTAHLAFAMDDDNDPTNQSSNSLVYMQLNITDLTGTILTKITQRLFDPFTGVKEPDYPALAAKGNSVRLVWQLTSNASDTYFYLAYNYTDDNGTSWGVDDSSAITHVDYKYIPSNENAWDGPDNTGAGFNWDERVNTSGSIFLSGLRPDVAIAASGGMTSTHVVWHGEKSVFGSSYSDVMHTYQNSSGGGWNQSAVYNGEDPVSMLVKMTDVTYMYKNGTTAFPAEKAGAAKVFFGGPGNRLQVVYLTEDPSSNVRKVRYNGWQLGDPGSADATLKMLDSDCDTYPNAAPGVSGEFEYGDGSTTPDTCATYNAGAPDGGGYNGYDVLDCDGDALADYLDINSDNDYMWDDVDDNRYEYRDPDGVFLPIILK